MRDPSDNAGPAGDDLLVVLCTVPTPEAGAVISRAVVEQRLAACVNIVPGLRSIYRWEGKVQDDPEALLIIKTRRSLFDGLRSRIVELHPYSVPEIVALEATACHAPYLAWALESTTDPAAR